MKKLFVLLAAVLLLVSATAGFAQEPANMADLKALDASLTEDIHIPHSLDLGTLILTRVGWGTE